MSRLYEVTFNKYTNHLRDTVWNEKEKRYIHTSEPVIIREEQIHYMKYWGEGINTLKYVGVLAFESDDKKGE